jgi:muconolactone D-isomerase
MEFLVNIDTSPVWALPAAQRDDLIKREQERGLALMSEGVIKHMWRRMGHQGVVSVWAAKDADELQALLSTLPIWFYVDWEVTPLVTHPLTTQFANHKLRGLKVPRPPPAWAFTPRPAAVSGYFRAGLRGVGACMVGGPFTLDIMTGAFYIEVAFDMEGSFNMPRILGGCHARQDRFRRALQPPPVRW